MAGLVSVASALEIKVDFGSGNVMPGFSRWNATSGSLSVNSIQFTLFSSNLPEGPKLRESTDGSSDDLTYDCISAEDPGGGTKTFTLTITNLCNGTYELLTYFNRLKDWGCTQQVKVDGILKAGPVDAPMERDMANCLQLVAEFSVTQGTSQVITVDWEDISDDGVPFICGFQLSSKGPTIGFASETSGNLESVTPAMLDVVLNRGEEGQTYTVDYDVTGGSAIGGGVDYSLAGVCACDLDDSGQVGFSDIVVLTEEWLCQVPCNIADITNDSNVNEKDFAVCGLEWLDFCGSNTLVFGPGETSKKIVIDITQDGRIEEDETIEVALTEPTASQLDLYRHTYTILDTSCRVSFASVVSSGPESVTTVNIPVTLTLASTQTVSVNYAVTGGTATGGGVDYTLGNGTLQFAAGVTTQNINITVLEDSIQEPSETIVLALSNPTNALIGGITQHTYTIHDRDGVLWDAKTWYYSSAPNTHLFTNGEGQLEWNPEVGEQFITRIPERRFSKTGDIVEINYLWMTDGAHDCPPNSCLICEGRCAKDIRCISGTSDFRVGLFEANGQYITANGFEVRSPLFVGYKGYAFRFGPNIDPDTPTRWVECPGEANEEVHKTGNFVKKPHNSDNLLTINEGLMEHDYIPGFGLPPGEFSLFTLRLERLSSSSVLLSITLNGETYTAIDDSSNSQPQKIDTIAVHMRNPRPFTRLVLDTVR